MNFENIQIEIEKEIKLKRDKIKSLKKNGDNEERIKRLKQDIVLLNNLVKGKGKKIR